ncbi:hypothetical protein SNEBB_002723, partial [Seison nebaliae]
MLNSQQQSTNEQTIKINKLRNLKSSLNDHLKDLLQSSTSQQKIRASSNSQSNTNAEAPRFFNQLNSPIDLLTSSNDDKQINNPRKHKLSIDIDVPQEKLQKIDSININSSSSTSSNSSSSHATTTSSKTISNSSSSSIANLSLIQKFIQSVQQQQQQSPIFDLPLTHQINRANDELTQHEFLQKLQEQQTNQLPFSPNLPHQSTNIGNIESILNNSNNNKSLPPFLQNLPKNNLIPSNNNKSDFNHLQFDPNIKNGLAFNYQKFLKPLLTPSQPTSQSSFNVFKNPSNHSLEHSQNNGNSNVNNHIRRKNATRETTATLKAWLYEHRKNPYPTKGEKVMLAILTKMTLTQVSTWFANARRRLKKENRGNWSSHNSGCSADEDDDVDGDDGDDEDNVSCRSTEKCIHQPSTPNTSNQENLKRDEVNKNNGEEEQRKQTIHLPFNIDEMMREKHETKKIESTNENSFNQLLLTFIQMISNNTTNNTNYQHNNNNNKSNDNNT